MSRTHKDTKRYIEKLSSVTGKIETLLLPINTRWKRVRRKIRRAMEKNALRKGQESPVFKKCDLYDYW